MTKEQLQKIVLHTLDDMKADDVVVLDVRKLTSITDEMIICSGNSSRHVKSIAKNLVEKLKEQGVRPLGVEGEELGEWVLVDLIDIVVHIMQPTIRTFYNLERLWENNIKRPFDDQ
jgi:ribosome-associated protein